MIRLSELRPHERRTVKAAGKARRGRADPRRPYRPELDAVERAARLKAASARRLTELR